MGEVSRRQGRYRSAKVQERPHLDQADGDLRDPRGDPHHPVDASRPRLPGRARMAGPCHHGPTLDIAGVLVGEQDRSRLERKPDVEWDALHAMLRRVLGPELTVARTPAGVAAQVYRVQAAGHVLYVRIAEEAHEDLSVDAALLEHLGGLGLGVPPVVHVEPFDQAIGRSVLIMGEITGTPVAQCRDERAARRVTRAAGRELAMLNRVGVQGFGWIQRRPPVWPLHATSRDYADFVTTDLPDPWPGPLEALFSTSELDQLWELVDSERRRELASGTLAHGDFDTTHIFQVDGRYTGLIDLGELRGAEPLFDLGHFYLWDHQNTPVPLLDDLLAGYGEVDTLPGGHEELVRRSAALLGLRQLARWLGPSRTLRPGHPAATARAARLRQILAIPGSNPSTRHCVC